MSLTLTPLTAGKVVTHIYLCLLAILAPYWFLLVLGGLGVAEATAGAGFHGPYLYEVVPGAFVANAYVTAGIALAYAMGLRLGKIKSRWWVQLFVLPPLLFFVIPTAETMLAIKLVGTETKNSDAMILITQNIVATFALSVAVLILGLAINRRTMGTPPDVISTDS